ncbi:MAG: serine hydrolase [Litoricola sp.]|nr:serine hydrolase [Litorivicinus sp.]
MQAQMTHRLIRSLTTAALLLGAQGSLGYEYEKTTPEDVGYDSAKLEMLRETADSLFEDGRIPNYVLALYKDGKRFFEVTRGKTVIPDGKNVDTNTIYHLASMSKPIVTTAVFRLAQEGKIDINDKLSKYFPAFKQMMVAPDGDFANQFEAANREITLLDLITHSSGFTYSENIAGYGDVGRTYSELGVFSGSGKTMVEHMATLAEIPLVAHPGEEFNYSVSIDVLGAVVEQVTKMSLADYLSYAIFDPLGMESTGFTLTETQSNNTSFIYGVEPFAPNPDFKFMGKLSDAEDAIEWKIAPLIPPRFYMQQPSFYSGGGGLLASADDFARYLSMVAGNGTIDGVTILDPEYAEMHKKSLVGFGAEAFAEAFGDAAQYMTFGGGFGIKNQPDNPAETDYIFWGGAFNTFFWLDPLDNSSGVFYTAHWPVQYNISDNLEQIVDEARK